MLHRIKSQWRRRVFFAAAAMLALALAALPFRGALALIMGGEGNKPLTDPGWPAGAAAIFNHTGRLAYWEGPPFGGGEWHAECRGDTDAFNKVLADFAKIDAKLKQITVYDGVGTSFWLNMNGEEAKKEAAKMDWCFVVWQRASWDNLRKMPARFSPISGADEEKGPPVRIDVYTGGNIKWADVKMPEGIEVTDQRMAAHGFDVTDGVVLEGKVVDLDTKKPLAAKVKIQRYEKGPEGHYKYVTFVAETTADAQGHWAMKKAPVGSHRIVVEMDGYLSRVVGHTPSQDTPRWFNFDSGLTHAAPMTGRILDDEGKPLADADVYIQDVTATNGGAYETPEGSSVKTDAQGSFSVQTPVGTASIWVTRPGYYHAKRLEKISTTAKDLSVTMAKSAKLKVTVDFTGGAPRPKEYIVDIEPEGGHRIGSWGGSGNIDAKNEYTAQVIPPGTYTLKGHPNPYSEKQFSPPVKVVLKGGETTEVTLTAKLPPDPPPPAQPPPKKKDTSTDAF